MVRRSGRGANSRRERDVSFHRESRMGLQRRASFCSRGSANAVLFFTPITPARRRTRWRRIRAWPSIFSGCNSSARFESVAAIEKTSLKESEEYFASRPIGSQLGAWASPQSEVIPNRDALEEKISGSDGAFRRRRRCRCRKTGAVIVSCRTQSSSGKVERIACTIVSVIRAQRDGSWIIERLSP